MFDWLRNLLAKPRRPVTSADVPRVRARYENALFNDENSRQWAQVDYLSINSANSFQIRRTLRIRSRYETSNNPFLWGVCNSNADDLVSTGPTLQVMLPEAAKKQIERAWKEWADEVDLVDKLRTLKMAKTVDGDSFLILKTVELEQSPVQLYPLDIEADQVTAPMAKTMEEMWYDGIDVHPVTRRPTAYTVMRRHPGDYFFPDLNPIEADKIKARYIIHWFAKQRPQQLRGIPAFTSALDLFAELRAFRKAVLTKANIAANLTAVLETEGPAAVDANGNPIQPKPFDNIPIDRGTMTTLPGGAKLSQFQTGEPSTTYEMFQEKCLGEACRPLAYPLNLALGTSQKFNFSSARLDHINYRNSLNVERAECDRIVLDRLFKAWLDEAIMIPGLLPKGINSIADVPHEWHWPGYEPLDPVQDATADHARINNGTMTWQQFWASRGYDWRQVMAQQAEEKKEIERLEIVFGDPLRKTERIEETASPKTQPLAAVMPIQSAQPNVTVNVPPAQPNNITVNAPEILPAPPPNIVVHAAPAPEFATVEQMLEATIEGCLNG